MAADTKAPAFKFTTNIPVQTVIRFVDVRPGKPWTDPKTGVPKMLPTQVSLKGSFDGVDTICFLPGATWKNIKALAAAGIIADQNTDALEEVDKVTSIALLTHEPFIATLSKPAGAQYADMTYAPVATVPAAQPASRRIPPPPLPTAKQPVTLGAPIAGMDESPYEETPAIPAWHKNVPLPTDENGFETFSAAIDSLNPNAAPALTPREVKQQEAAANGESPVDKLVANFADLYAQTLGALVAVHHAAGASTTVPHSRVGDIPALTTECVYKVAVSLWIDARRAGMYQ